MIIDYGTRTVGIKIVFFGPAMSGKTTAIKWLFRSLGEQITSIENTVGRTMFMDFGTIPFSLGDSWTINSHVWSATGQDFYRSTREVVLVGADGIVFVADAQAHLQDENLASWNELLSTVEESDEMFPIAVFLNKTDLPNTVDEAKLRSHLNISSLEIPVFAGIASEGHNVLETFQWLFQEAIKSGVQ
ncbi:MAG: ADP-ribosylation factor-like protein [Candidatus Thorarchaeota archaeon]